MFVFRLDAFNFEKNVSLEYLLILNLKVDDSHSCFIEVSKKADELEIFSNLFFNSNNEKNEFNRLRAQIVCKRLIDKSRLI